MKKFFIVATTVLFAVAVFIFIITFSIGLPIYCRFFYYLQIEPLGIPEITGFDYATIKSSYDAVLDYLVLPNRPFSVGAFKYSESGASHFADCKVLFDLNAVALIISTAVIVLTLILDKTGVVKLKKINGFSVSLFSAIGIFALIIILAIVVAIDFDSAFTAFHHLFFPGKDNWTFHPYKDQIILALPAQFFMNCAILIGASIFLLSAGIITFCLIKRKKTANSNKIVDKD